jgi:hypothetical protein
MAAALEFWGVQRVIVATLEPSASAWAVTRKAGIYPGQHYGWAATFGRLCAAADRSGGVMTGFADPGTIEFELAARSRMPITGAV